MPVVTELEPFGVEIAMDLSEPLSMSTRAWLQELFAAHHLLRFRGHEGLEADDQVRVVGYLGQVLELSGGRRYEFVANNDPNSLFGSGEISWHSDMAATPEPYVGISLFGLDVVDGASTTCFASAACAYRRLPDEVQGQISALATLQVMGTNYSGRNRASELSAAAPSTTHPLVWHHERTGEPFMFVPWQQTDSVVGLSDSASEDLLSELFHVLFADDNVLEHRWSAGDLVIWDNRMVQHRRGDVASVGTRVLRRVTLGRRTLRQMYPQFAEMTTEAMRASLNNR